jgi:YD repeat-containing protein
MFTCIGVYSQNENQGTDLPSFTLPSPQADAFTKYGNVPINESTGKVTASVPIHTFTAGKLSLPISLNYMGNGVKVDANNTWTGVNWTLDAGGVITRTIHHKVDELATGRIFKQEIDSLISVYEAEEINSDNADAEIMQTYFGRSGIQWDTQPDIFNFSFAGHSGSFYLNKEFIPTLINVDSNLKIEILGSETNTDKQNLSQNNEFKITDTNGIEYYFGGAAIEVTHMEQDWHNIITPEGVTSFYLTQIKHPLNGIIYLDYDNGGSSKIATSQNRTIVKYEFSPKLGYDGGCSRSPNEEEPLEEVNNIQSTLVYTKIMQSVKLSRIYSSSNYEILFNSTPQGGYHVTDVLNNIEVKMDDNIFFKYDFEYDFTMYGNHINRFFLKKVVYNNINEGNNRKNKEYSFEYKQPLDLPNRFSNAQDALGYYNGKNSNTSILPDVNTLPSGLLGSPGNVLGSCTTCTADRSADMDYKTYGTLTKLYYPTGGYTLFEYEPEETKKTSVKRVNLHAWSNDTFRSPQSNYPVGAYIGNHVMNDPGDPSNPSVFEDHLVTATMNITLGSTANLDYHDFIDFTVEDVDTQVIQRMRFNFPTNTTDMYYNTTQISISDEFSLLKNHNYNFSLNFGDVHNNSFTTTKVHATVYFDYINGYELFEGEGLRVKRVSDYSGDIAASVPQNIKRYYYKKPEHIFDNSLEFVPIYREPSFYEQHMLLKKTYTTKVCFFDPVGNKYERKEITCNIDTHNGYSLSMHPSNYDEFLLTNYKDVVISYGGDNFENGGVVKVFEVEGGNKIMDYHIGGGPRPYENLLNTHKNASWLFLNNGKLHSEIFIKKDSDDVLYKIKQKSYHYDYETVYVEPIIVGTVLENCGPGDRYPYGNVGLGQYDIFSRKTPLKEQINTDYIDPIPLNTGVFIDESNYKKTTTTTDYEYDSYAGQPTKITTSTSDSEVIKETKHYYANQIDQISNLPQGQSVIYTALHDLNRVYSPIYTEEIETDTIVNISTLLASQRTLYKDENGLINPEIIQSSKGQDVLENRVIYNKYDEKGNPVELFQKDGTTVVYKWANLFNKPVVKIVNATYAQVESVNWDLSLLPNAQITTYGYTNDPLHLLSRVTDPRGQTVYYEYDEFNRLKFVKDHEGNILSKNEYNYRQN